MKKIRLDYSHGCKDEKEFTEAYNRYMIACIETSKRLYKDKELSSEQMLEKYFALFYNTFGSEIHTFGGNAEFLQELVTNELLHKKIKIKIKK
jgi:hypothetical protein